MTQDIVTATAPPPGPGPGLDDEPHESVVARMQQVLHGRPTLGPLAVLIVAIAAFAVDNPNFLSGDIDTGFIERVMLGK